MKFLLDVNVSRSIVPWLVDMGHDVALVTERDRRMSDDRILDWAVREQRIIITADKETLVENLQIIRRFSDD
jgi:predicted nuclease of predicted toxin-antitoxin system